MLNKQFVKKKLYCIANHSSTAISNHISHLRKNRVQNETMKYRGYMIEPFSVQYIIKMWMVCKNNKLYFEKRHCRY